MAIDLKTVIDQYIAENSPELIHQAANKRVEDTRRHTQAEYNHIANQLRTNLYDTRRELEAVREKLEDTQLKEIFLLEFLAERGLLEEYKTHENNNYDPHNDYNVFIPDGS